MPDDEKTTTKPVKRSVTVWVLIVVTTLPFAAATLLGFAGGWDWRLDLLSHGRVIYALVLTVFTVYALLTRWWRTGCALAGLALVNVALIAPLYVASPPPPAPGPTLKLLHFNVLASNNRSGDVARFIEQSGSHLVCIQEVNERWLLTLNEELPSYRVLAASPQQNQFGIAMLALRQLPEGIALGDAEIQHPPDRLDPARSIAAQITAQVWLGDRELSLLAMHAAPPISAYLCERRQSQFDTMIDWANARTRPAVVIGDLNSTPWSAAFGRIRSETELLNSQRGYGLATSFPAGNPALFRIPIDHCLHTAELVAIDRRNGPDLGSDHLPLLVELAWAAD